jgi:hypothetical protein
LYVFGGEVTKNEDYYYERKYEEENYPLYVMRRKQPNSINKNEQEIGKVRLFGGGKRRKCGVTWGWVVILKE